MPDTIKVRSLSVFEDSATGQWVSAGDEIDVTESRAAELMAHRLVEKMDGAPAEAVKPVEAASKPAPRRG